MPQVSGVFEKLAAVERRIDQAARKAGRSSSEVALMAVTKYAPEREVRELLASGKVRHAGESRVQDMGERAPGVEYHFIGHLQTNKAGKAAAGFDWIDSVDSLELAEKLDKQAEKAGKKLKALLQVQPVPNPKQSGVQPEKLDGFLKQLKGFKNLDVKGLMCIAPLTDAVEDTRPHFRRIRQLFDVSFPSSASGAGRPVLSMGMSRDFEIAIEEGATLVRIGSLLFSS